MRQRLTDATKSSVALITTSQMSRDSDTTGCLAILYVPERPRLLIVPVKLGDDDVSGAQQAAVLDQKAAAADDGDHAVRRIEKRSGGRRFIEHLQYGVHVLVRDKVASVLDHNCTRASSAKLAQSNQKSTIVLLTARRCSLLMR